MTSLVTSCFHTVSLPWQQEAFSVSSSWGAGSCVGAFHASARRDMLKIMDKASHRARFNANQPTRERMAEYQRDLYTRETFLYCKHFCMYLSLLPDCGFLEGRTIIFFISVPQKVSHYHVLSMTLVSYCQAELNHKGCKAALTFKEKKQIMSSNSLHMLHSQTHKKEAISLRKSASTGKPDFPAASSGTLTSCMALGKLFNKPAQQFPQKVATSIK